MESCAIHRTLGVGEMLNWYRIERVLGRGGFGVIYLATDTNLECSVAIKEYLPPGLARRAGDTAVEPLTERHGELYRWGLERFIKEARNLVRFKHPNIVRVMSVFQENNTAYMVMDFEAGESLCRHLERPGTASEARLRALAAPLVDGLDEVHRHGFIHRDIKPANILVRPDGSPVLLDFGSARSAARALGDGAMTALVSAGYAPLEQYDDVENEQQGPWTDIYALGGVLYYAIGGADPVDSARRGAALLNGARDPLIPATTLGAGRYTHGFLTAIDWALEHRIADRPQSLADWRPALLGDAVAVDATERRRALHALPVHEGRRKSRRFEDHDDFGDLVGPGTGPNAGPDSGPSSGPNAGASQGTAAARAEVPSTAVPSTEKPRTGRSRGRTRDPAREARERSEHGRTARRSAPRTRPPRSSDPADVTRVGFSRVRAVIAASVLVGSAGVAWFAAEQSSDAASAARERAALEARELALAGGADPGPDDVARTPAPVAEPNEAAGATSGASTADTESDRSASDGAASAEADMADDAPAVAGADAPAGTAGSSGSSPSSSAPAGTSLGPPDRARADDAAATEARARDVAERARQRTAAEAAAADARLLRERRDRLAAEASARREAAVRARYEAALDTAARALGASDLSGASGALAEARATGREGTRLRALTSALATAQADRRRPVTDEEFERVVRRFDSLKRAIEAKDIATIEALTVQSGQNSLFAQLMGGFEELNMEITGIRVHNADKSVTANLRIRDMRRDNGDRAMPSPAYRDRDITSRLRRGQWSRIEW